jgi:predicted flap endonuclease-1-like 5' DNA nuclease
MTYLFSQYWMFIALAFTLGLFVGWATCGEGDDKGSGWLAWAIVGFLAALFLALFKVVPGFAGHLLEVALLLSGAYAIGCAAGCGGHWASGGARSSADGGGDASAASTREAPAQAEVTHAEIFGNDTSASYPGVRPEALVAPRGGKADDLTAIAGVDAGTAKALGDIGVHHHDQIAAWGAPQTQWVEHHLAQVGRIDREDWVAQARRLAGAGGMAAVAVGAGATSGASQGGGAADETVASAAVNSNGAASSSASVATSASTPPDAQASATATDGRASAEAGATADAPASAGAPRMMTDGARSLLAQQQKKDSRAASGGSPAASAPAATEPASAEEIVPATSPASSARAFAGPARAPMTDGARSLAVLKRKDEERAARRAAAASARDANADASASSSENSANVAADANAAGDENRPRADDKPAAPADDLKLIKGVGPANEKALNDLGVRRFAQIADWSPGNARWVAESLSFPGRIERERWVDQSKLLAAGVDTAYSSGVKSGAIAIGADADAPMSTQEAEAFASSLPQQAAAVENEASYSGARPLGLVAPRGGKADDLKLIKGIGKQNEERLHALGVWHFDQIAAWSAENVKWIGSYLAFPGRIDREHWIEQATQFSRELARRVESGAAPASRLI